MKYHLTLTFPLIATLSFALPTEIILSPHPGLRGAVASESIECTKIGRSTLACGGNAADAMIATTLCVGVIGMYHSGIGGGGFALVRDAKGNYEAVDFRETAPRGAGEDMYAGNIEGSILGGLAVGVPGELRGLAYIHEKYGSLPWKDLVLPAAHLAHSGFRVSSDLVRYANFTLAQSPANFLVNDPIWAEDFAPAGRLLTEGETLRRPRYAKTLKTIALRGVDEFYSGNIAKSLVNTIRAANGTMTLDDLKDYQVFVREPLTFDYRNHTLTTIGAPASGAILLNNLATMDQWVDGPKLWETDRALSFHRFDEAMRFAYGARMRLGDPSFTPTAHTIERHILSPDVIARIHSSISDSKSHPPLHYILNNTAVSTTPGAGTSHVVTADATGMSISLTTTINLLFGAQLMDPETGIILNNEMNDFSIPGVPNEFGFAPAKENFIRPGKRPLSSVVPVIITDHDGNLKMAVGAAGGSRIISSTTQVIWHVLEHGMDLRDALRERRIHDQLVPDVMTFEDGFDEEVKRDMESRGHNVTQVRLGLSAVQGIWKGPQGFLAGGEPRQRNSGGLTL